MPDVEESIPVAGPLDVLEQAVLVVLVVARFLLVALLTGADVPLLRGHDRRRVRREPGHSVPEHARREDMRAVDHERERFACAQGRVRG